MPQIEARPVQVPVPSWALEMSRSIVALKHSVDRLGDVVSVRQQLLGANQEIEALTIERDAFVRKLLEVEKRLFELEANRASK